MIRARAIPIQTEGHLPEDIRRAKAKAKEWFKVLQSAGFKPEAPGASNELERLTDGFFEFYDGKELDDGHAGVRGLNEDLHGRHRAYFLKCRVGKAHAGDKRPAGQRRLVLKIDSAQIKRVYFTAGHYTDEESWTQLIRP